MDQLELVDRLDGYLWRQSTMLKLMFDASDNTLNDSDKRKAVYLLLEMMESQLAGLQRLRDDIEETRVQERSTNARI